MDVAQVWVVLTPDVKEICIDSQSIFDVWLPMMKCIIPTPKVNISGKRQVWRSFTNLTSSILFSLWLVASNVKIYCLNFQGLILQLLFFLAPDVQALLSRRTTQTPKVGVSGGCGSSLDCPNPWHWDDLRRLPIRLQRLTPKVETYCSDFWCWGLWRLSGVEVFLKFDLFYPLQPPTCSPQNWNISLKFPSPDLTSLVLPGSWCLTLGIKTYSLNSWGWGVWWMWPRFGLSYPQMSRWSA